MPVASVPWNSSAGSASETEKVLSKHVTDATGFQDLHGIRWNSWNSPKRTSPEDVKAQHVFFSFGKPAILGYNFSMVFATKISMEILYSVWVTPELL